eukprot:1156916-Pelagomonas_calceolata.AAC.11
MEGHGCREAQGFDSTLLAAPDQVKHMQHSSDDTRWIHMVSLSQTRLRVGPSHFPHSIKSGTAAKP